MAPSTGPRKTKRKLTLEDRQTTISTFFTSGSQASNTAPDPNATRNFSIRIPITTTAEPQEDATLSKTERATKRQKVELKRQLDQPHAEYITVEHKLDVVEVCCNPQTSALNKWNEELAKGLQMRPNAPQKYTPTDGDLLHILQYDPYPGRRFELREEQVKQFTVRRRHGPVKCWRLVILDKGRANAPEVELFKLPARGFRERRLPEDNAIDITICPQKGEAIRLGNVVCDILNRIPADDLSEATWNRVTLGFLNKYRKFVETTALLSWDPGFDFSTLSETFISTPRAKYNYTVPVKDHGDYTVSSMIPGTLAISEKGLGAQSYQEGIIEIRIPNAVNIAAIEALPDVPERYFFGAEYNGTRNEVDYPELPAIVNAHRYIRKELFGRCGTVRQFKDYIDDIRSRFSLRVHAQPRGIVNGYALWGKPKNDLHKKIILQPPQVVRDMMYYRTDEGAQPLGKRDLEIKTATHNRLLIAFIYQQGITTYAAGKGLMNAIQAMCVAASLVDLGELTEDIVKQVFCTCSEEEARRMEHPCQHCFAPRLCRDLAVDVKGRRLCRSCAVSKHTDFLLPTVTSYVSILIRSVMWTDKLPLSAKPRLQSKLSTQIVDRDRWNDAYNGLESFEMSTYRDGALRAASSGGRKLTHPRQPSVDKVYCFYVDKKGVIHLHHEDNVVLTKWALNILKALHIPSLLPFFAQAVRFTTLFKSSNIGMSEYNAFFATFDAASDNAHMINLSRPQSVKSRLENKMGYTRAQFLNELRPQYRSGVWSGKPYGNSTLRFATRGLFEPMLLQKRKGTVREETLYLRPWSTQRRRALTALINQIEGSTRFNPDRLILPRGREGAPWFFRAELMYDDYDYDWLFRELRARLITWDELCNKAHETIESPATLLVELAVQWFESGGGRCHLLGCRFTPYMNHPQAYSFGRGLTRIDEDGQTVNIIPGENMRTGCTTTTPTDILADYNICRRTVVVETWVANRARFNFPVETMDILRDCITSIAPETEWYEACKEQSAYRRVNYPKLCRRGSTAQLDSFDDSFDDSEDLKELADDELKEIYGEEEPLDPYDDFSNETSFTAEAEGSIAQYEPKQLSYSGAEVQEEGRLEEGELSEPALAGEGPPKRFSTYVLKKLIAHMINLRADDCVGPDSPLWGYFLERVEADGSSIERAYPTKEGTFRLDEKSSQAGRTVAWLREDGSIVDAEGGIVAQFDPFAGSAEATSPGVATPAIKQRVAEAKDAEEKAWPDDEMAGVEVTNSGMQVAISQATFAKLMHRRGLPSPLSNPADPDTPQAAVVVSFGKWPNEELAFPNADREYVTAGGQIVAECNDEGQITDLEGNFLGQL